MIETANIIVLNKILCEDVRQEQNNKHILIGVYSGDILLGELPAAVRLTFYLEVAFKTLGSHNFHFRLSGPGEGSAEMKMAANVTETGSANAITGPRMEIMMEREGLFKFQLSEGDDQWVTLIEKKIIHQPGLTA